MKSRDNNALYRRQKRQEAIDYLGGKCEFCDTTEDLQFDHLDATHQEEDRLARRQGKRAKNKKISSVYVLKKHHTGVRLLCKSCHKKWSCAQRSAAYKLFASLSLEEQIDRTKSEFIEG
jgi:hypothetical protein